MNARVMVLLALIAVAGCGTTTRTYVKAGAVPDEQRRDEAECIKAAMGSDRAIPGVMCIDREVVERCMKDRGYSASP